MEGETMTTDNTPRYTPSEVMVFQGMRPVLSARAYSAGAHPHGCPLMRACTALQLVTDAGSHWYGVERAWINSELRMVVKGFPAAFEEMARWQVCAKI